MGRMGSLFVCDTQDVFDSSLGFWCVHIHVRGRGWGFWNIILIVTQRTVYSQMGPNQNDLSEEAYP